MNPDLFTQIFRYQKKYFFSIIILKEYYWSFSLLRISTGLRQKYKLRPKTNTFSQEILLKKAKIGIQNSRINYIKSFISKLFWKYPLIWLNGYFIRQFENLLLNYGADKYLQVTCSLLNLLTSWDIRYFIIFDNLHLCWSNFYALHCL